MTDIHYLVFSVALTWIMVLTSSSLRTREWTLAGMKMAFSNRDAVPEPTPIAGRADRAAKNMLENMVFFIGLFVAARAAGADAGSIATGCALFFFARLLYFIVYLIGIPYLRTFIWAASIVGLGLIGLAAIRGH